MITKVWSSTGFEKRTGKHKQLTRGLAEAGIIDAYLCDNDRIVYPLHAEQQLRDYERKRRAERKAEAAAA